MERRSQRSRLLDIEQACQKILDRAAVDRSAFERDEMLQVWVVHHLEVIGEAATHVAPSIKEAHPEVDWIAASATRDRLAHGYFDVDVDVIWEVVVRDIPALRDQIVGILEGMPGEDDVS